MKCSWILWQSQGSDKRLSREEYRQCMERVASCDTIEAVRDLLEVPEHVPSRMTQGFTFHFVRKDSRCRKPCWERFPRGGAWTFPLQCSQTTVVDRTWRRLVMGLASEALSDRRIIGVLVSRRESVFTLSIWHRNCSDVDARGVEEEIRDLLQPERVCVVYTPFSRVIRLAKQALCLNPQIACDA